MEVIAFGIGLIAGALLTVLPGVVRRLEREKFTASEKGAQTSGGGAVLAGGWHGR